MLHIDPPPPPPGLTSAKAVAERAALITFYATPGNEKLPYSKGFSAYSSDGVREALTAAFSGKCAYCESTYIATQPSDIEHYRPKGGISLDTSKPLPPGYWWLASEWTNLLPSCADCNRPRRQDFPAGLPKTAGKANKFPIATETKRAQKPGDEQNEPRLLLHPYFDHPEQHLRFVTDKGTIEDGEIRPVKSRRGTPSKLGEVSIEVYALQRLGLIETRRAMIRRLIGHLEVTSALRDAILKLPQDQKLREAFRAAVEALGNYVSATQPYSAMCRQIVAEFGNGMFTR